MRLLISIVCQNVTEDNIEVVGMDLIQSEHSVEPIALVEQGSYANGDDSTNWIIDSESTHHMNGFANEFLNMKLEG
jgi:hypothetical protein